MTLPFKSCPSKVLPLFDRNGQRVIAGCWSCQTWLKICRADPELLPSCQYAHFGPLWVHQFSPRWSGMRLGVPLMRLKLCSFCLGFWMMKLVLQSLSQSPLGHLHLVPMLQKQHGHKPHQTHGIEKYLKYININQSITAKQIYEF